MRILVVENDRPDAAPLEALLQQRGWAVDPAGSTEEAMELLRHYEYDLVLADAAGHGIDGIALVQRMRSARVAAPVMLLTAGNDADHRVKALSAGADDVLSAPVDKEELFARLSAIVRRSRGHSRAVLQVGPLSLDLDARQASVDGRDVPLTGKEYAILELLVLRKGMALSKETFLNHLYNGMDEPEMKIIDVFVCKLRKKLAQAGAPELIGTIWGRGYILRDPVANYAIGDIGAADVRTLLEVA